MRDLLNMKIKHTEDLYHKVELALVITLDDFKPQPSMLTMYVKPLISDECLPCDSQSKTSTEYTNKLLDNFSALVLLIHSYSNQYENGCQ